MKEDEEEEEEEEKKRTSFTTGLQKIVCTTLLQNARREREERERASERAEMDPWTAGSLSSSSSFAWKNTSREQREKHKRI